MSNPVADVKKARNFLHFKLREWIDSDLIVDAVMQLADEYAEARAKMHCEQKAPDGSRN